MSDIYKKNPNHKAAPSKNNKSNKIQAKLIKKDILMTILDPFLEISRK